MGFLSSLLLILKAVPALVSLITEIAAWMRSTFGDNPEKYLLDVSQAFKQARESKSPQERANAAQTIAGLIRRL